MSLSSAAAWELLIHAHDRLLARKEIPLSERHPACQILWEAAIRLHRETARARRVSFSEEQDYVWRDSY